MKKQILLLALTLFFTLAACGNSNQLNNEETSSGSDAVETIETLEEISAQYEELQEGQHSEAYLASWIQEATRGDIFSIRVTEPYSSDWDECLSRANEEKAAVRWPFYPLLRRMTC